jgi:hypothetical protein
MLAKFMAKLISVTILACGAAYAGPISAIDAIAELEKAPTDNPVQVLSYYRGLGKGGGLFAWNAASSAAPDGCFIFAGKAGKGRWIRQSPGALDASMCGAWWDNAHDDAEPLNRAFKAAAAQHITLSLPGGIGKICSTVKAMPGVILRGQGMGPQGNIAASPTLVNADCLKAGWAFEITNANGTAQQESPKYYDMSIKLGNNNNPGGCIRWNRADGGFTDNAASQNYMMHPHAERIYCEMQATKGNQQIGLQCSKCFDGDFSQNETMFGKTGIDLEGSDVMCIGCAGPNRVSGSQESLIRMISIGTFGNMDRLVGNELLYPIDQGQRYDSFILDNARSSTIEANHIEGTIKGAQSAIHLVVGFSHSVVDNDIDVLTDSSNPVPHWLVADGPFVNVRVFNNGVAGIVMGPALFNGAASQPNFNLGGVHQTITHGGNAKNGDSGFP